MTEEQLILGCQEGSERAQRLIYDLFSRKMMGVCLRYAGSEEDAQDILQDGFVKVFESIKKYSGKGSFEGWVRRVMVNTSLDYCRKMKKERMNVGLEDIDYKVSVDDYIIESLEARDLLELINKVPNGYRVVFNMYAIEGYSHKEIADKLGISVNTSKSQFSRAKNCIKKLIKELITVSK